MTAAFVGELEIMNTSIPAIARVNRNNLYDIGVSFLISQKKEPGNSRFFESLL
jgi:hypothetical protein